MTFDECIVDTFMKAWFKRDFSILNQDDFKIIYSQYQDTSGLFLTSDFEKQSFILHLTSRINYVKMFIRLQREFIEDFGRPFLREKEVNTLKDKYGYIVKWNDDFEDFEKQLKKIESREIKHNSTLEARIKELNSLRQKQNKKEETEEESEESLLKSRLSFIRMTNSLGKLGYKYDKMTTSVEELSLMIKQQLEDSDKN